MFDGEFLLFAFPKLNMSYPFFPDFTLIGESEDINFSYINESVNFTCSINTQTIHNFSADQFTIKVKKCGVTHKLLPGSNITNFDIIEIFVRDQIEEPLCEDQNWLNYKCYYDVNEDTSCEVGEEKVIYFDCKEF